jgi:hypothetical protein
LKARKSLSTTGAAAKNTSWTNVKDLEGVFPTCSRSVSACSWRVMILILRIPLDLRNHPTLRIPVDLRNHPTLRLPLDLATQIQVNPPLGFPGD